ncbi:molecular chaperone DnaK (HSP70) [Saccharothrix tamanrassetensis]|uniref:Molecular chaperone DnaK (HSP70) n=1 Tax=Saccharothrix tamanrassetensis TaxID=1051531 RepID=A0A841CQU3_9PSEU|nr:Hsp70 family protein [Saccharothrix tamanrassetensis]MBB5959590.1 molecular chaperone DnaK (HSP70) [Saccharothrix tamanrassetensis]
MTVYGIDLGTTYSCIARVDDAGRPAVIRNSIGEESTPSVVYFESPHHVVVGREAKNAALVQPELVVSLIKRDIGKSGMTLDFHGTEHTPESISALVLRDLVKSVEGSTGEEVRDVVITVPAYFGVAEREATRQAGVIAGLNVVNVVPEPVAAALYYGVLKPGGDRTVLVFDLGGGTFDTTVIRLNGSDVTVVCTDGDHGLGGADWDTKLATLLGERFTAERPESEATESEDFLQDLGLLAEDLKKALTSRQSKQQQLHFRGARVTTEVSRQDFETITAELLGRTMDITARTLELAADRGVRHFDEVLLVGGSTRMPAVAEALRARFGFHPKVHEPDLAVAKGAALFALSESLRLRLGDHVEGDGAVDGVARELGMSTAAVQTMAGRKVAIVTPRAFGVAVVDPDDPEEKKFLVSHLLVANTPLPVDVTEQFKTSAHDQREIEIQIWEQAGALASERPEHNKQIGEALINRLPPMPKGSPVDVTFRMDENGTLNVRATEIRTGKTATTEIKIGDLDDRQIAAARETVARLS